MTTTTNSTNVYTNGTLTTAISPTTRITWSAGGVANPLYDIPSNIFTELQSIFNIEIEEKQLELLNTLYNTDDAANKLIAAEMFKHILKEHDHKKQKEENI